MKVRSNGFHVLFLSNIPMIGVSTHILLYNYLSDFIGEGRIFFKHSTKETKNILTIKKTLISVKKNNSNRTKYYSFSFFEKSTKIIVLFPFLLFEKLFQGYLQIYIYLFLFSTIY